MMEKPVYNAEKRTIYVGGRAIAPGATRHIPEEMIAAPHKHRIAAGNNPADMSDLESTPQAATIEEFRASTLGQIVPQIPDLADAELNELEALEQAQAVPRKGLLDAIVAERLARESRSLGD